MRQIEVEMTYEDKKTMVASNTAWELLFGW